MKMPSVLHNVTWVLLLLGGLQLTNPPPLLVGLDVAETPLEDVWVSANLGTDLGAYEYLPPLEQAIRGDLTFDRKVAMDDSLWFRACWRGPDSPYAEVIRHIATQKELPIACWLCDHDDDGDVDLKDYAYQQVITDA